MIISHTHKRYKDKWKRLTNGRYNGAYYYSQEIVKNIIPLVKTDRNWITVNLPGFGADHSIMFVHNNLHPENYDWLKRYNDIVMVCGVKETCEKVNHIGKAIYLPLSIDTEEVEQYRQDERSGAAFAGRPSKRSMNGVELPKDIDIIEGLPRDRFLQEIAKHETIYAVGRTAVEARALGCEIAAYDPRYPDPDVWQVLDNREAAKILQAELDAIDCATADMQWTKAELLEYCKAKGIEVTSRLTKAQIMERINA